MTLPTTSPSWLDQAALLDTSAAHAALLDRALQTVRVALAAEGLAVGTGTRRVRVYSRLGEDGRVLALEAPVQDLGDLPAGGADAGEPTLLLRCGICMEAAPDSRSVAQSLLVWACLPQDADVAWHAGADPTLAGLRLAGTILSKDELGRAAGRMSALAELEVGITQFGSTLEDLAGQFAWRLTECITP